MVLSYILVGCPCADCSDYDGDDRDRCSVKFIACVLTFAFFCFKKSITVVTTAVRMEQVVWMALSHTLVSVPMVGKGLIVRKVSIYPTYFL